MPTSGTKNALRGRQTATSLTPALASLLLILVALVSSAACFSFYAGQQLHRRSANEEARPIARQNARPLQTAASEQVVVGKFKAPVPERIVRHKLARPNAFGAQQVSASFRVADDVDQGSGSAPEKIVHGIVGASSAPLQQQQQRQAKKSHHVVSAKIQVSDEGLNYPPSKLSADIYGNVAEIVTAPPEAVESDFLVPDSTQIFGSRTHQG